MVTLDHADHLHRRPRPAQAAGVRGTAECGDQAFGRVRYYGLGGIVSCWPDDPAAFRVWRMF
jgi:hypothetical protein